MNTTMIRRGLAVATILGTTMVFGGSAQAIPTSVGGFAGIAQNPAKATCFTNSFGVVTNVCASTEQFCIPLFVEFGGPIVQVWGAGTVNGKSTCVAVSVTEDGLFSMTSGPQPFQGNDKDMVLDLGPMTVPTDGTLYTCCNLAPGARIDSVTW
jgi:hypothetical protein